MWVTMRLCPAGVLHPVRERELLRARRAALLRDPLPRAAGLAVLGLPEADHGALHHRHGQEVPPGALRVRLLPEAAQQGDFQGAEREAVLPRLLHQALQLKGAELIGGGGAWSNHVGEHCRRPGVRACRGRSLVGHREASRDRRGGAFSTSLIFLRQAGTPSQRRHGD